MALAFLLLLMAAIKPVRKRLRKLPGFSGSASRSRVVVGRHGVPERRRQPRWSAPKGYTATVNGIDTTTVAHNSTNITFNVQ
jgi:hypothetical protein